MELADQGQSALGGTALAHERTLQTGSDLRHRNILLDADEFVTKYELDDLRDEIRTGALLLDDPDGVGRCEGLTYADIQALQSDTRPMPIYSGTLTPMNEWYRSFPPVCAIGGYLLGFTVMPSLQLSYGDILRAVRRVSDKLAVVLVAAEYKGWCIAGCWCAVPLLIYCGRRGAAYVALGLRLASIVAALVFPAMFSREIAGEFAALASGMLSCIIPIYLVETSAISTRANVLLAWQISQRVGSIFPAPFAMAPLGGHVNPESISYALIIFPLIGLGVCFWCSPESPHWYISKGQMRQAYMALEKCRGNAAQAGRDLYRMYSFKALEERRATRGRKTRRMLQAVAITTALILSVIASEMSGILIMFSVADIVQDELSVPAKMGFSALTFCAFTLCCLLPSINLVERLGRRCLILTSMGIMSLTICGTMLAISVRPVSNIASVIAAPLTLAVPFAVLAMVCQLYVAEVSCAIGCDAAMAALMSVYNLRDAYVIQWAIRSVYLTRAWQFLSYYSAAPVLLFFAIQLGFLILLYLCLVETQRGCLEEIGARFEVPVTNRIAYRIRVYIPYLFKRLCRRQCVEPEQFEHSQYNTGAVRL